MSETMVDKLRREVVEQLACRGVARSGEAAYWLNKAAGEIVRLQEFQQRSLQMSQQIPDWLNLPEQDYSYVIGLTIKQAAEMTWMRIRVVEDDGEAVIYPQDYMVRRLNVSVRNGVIAEIKGVG